MNSQPKAPSQTVQGRKGEKFEAPKGPNGKESKAKEEKKPIPDAIPWLHFRVGLKLRNKMCGGIPMHEEVIASWIESTNKEKSDEARAEMVDATKEQLEEVKEEESARKWNGFMCAPKEGGLYIESRNVIAMLKEAANICKDIIGIKNLKSKVAERVFVTEPKVFLGRDKPDGAIEGPITVMTARGPRTSLKKVDYVEEAEINFTLKVLKDSSRINSVPEKAIKLMLEYAQEGGLGAGRSQGYGTFDLVEFEAI